MRQVDYGELPARVQARRAWPRARPSAKAFEMALAEYLAEGVGVTIADIRAKVPQVTRARLRGGLNRLLRRGLVRIERRREGQRRFLVWIPCAADRKAA